MPWSFFMLFVRYLAVQGAIRVQDPRMVERALGGRRIRTKATVPARRGGARVWERFRFHLHTNLERKRPHLLYLRKRWERQYRRRPQVYRFPALSRRLTISF